MLYLYFILPPIIMLVCAALALRLLSKKSLDLEDTGETNFAVGKSDPIKYAEFKSKGLTVLEKIAQKTKLGLLKLYNALERLLKSFKDKKEEIKSRRAIQFEDTLGKEDVLESERKKYSGFGDEELGTSKRTESVSNEVKPKAEIIERKSSSEVIETKPIEQPRRKWRGIDFDKSVKKMGLGAIKKSIAESPKKTIFRPLKKKNEPMISQSVVYPEKPQAPAPKKKELEEILVNRIAEDPRDVEAYERLGEYYVTQHNYADAVSCYKYVLKLNPSNEEAKEAIDKIEELEK